MNGWEGAGFDAVIGNPPYVGFRDFEYDFEYDKDYVVNRFSCATARFDLYMPFLEHCVSIVRRRGFFAFICPSTFALREHGRELRKVLLNRAALIRYHDFGDIAVFEWSQNYTCICVFQNDTKTSKVAYSARSSLSTTRLIEHRLTGDPWDFKFSASPLSSQKFRSIILPLEKLCSEINEGIVTGKNAAFTRSEKFHLASSNELLRHLVEGQDVSRFLAESSQYLLYTYRLIDGQTKVISEKELKESFGEAYDFLLSHKGELKGRSYLSQTTKKWYELWRPREINAQAQPKIVCPKLCSRATFALVDEGTYFLDTVYGIPTHRLCQYSASFLLATLNSQLTTCFLINVCPPKANSFFSNEREFLAQLPIRRIHFITPEAERKRLAQELAALAAVMTAPEALQGSRDLRASPLGRALDELLPIDEAGEFLAFKPGASGAEERSDVVHDLLAHLAERMIDLNRQKQTEMKRFLGWLDAILHIHPGKDGKTGIETLNGKTTLKNYLGDYQKGQEHVPFDNLVDVLQRNKGRLSRPLDGAFEQWMRQAYERSLELLLPIKQELSATDWLIDRLVYRLYGLTEEEVAIIEGRG